MNCIKIKNEKIENHSGYKVTLGKDLKAIKKNHFFVIDKNVGGDAPKEFIRVYEFGKVRKKKKNRWTGYIAKTGQKWYPAESITEYLLNKIGEILGLKMAESKLAFVGGQIRFMSKYFLKKDEILVHSAEILAGYLEGDIEFIDEVERQDLARNLFTFQFVKIAITKMFPNDFEAIINNFVKLIIFDAIVGNNDRHIYNWGVITNVSGNKPPVFSPIYDTARGLFWNLSQENILKKISHPKQVSDWITKYANNSRPKTGWEGVENINHFKLLEFLTKDNEIYKAFVVNLCSEGTIEAIFALIDSDFMNLFPKSRIELIKQCLKVRFEIIKSIVL